MRVHIWTKDEGGEEPRVMTVEEDDAGMVTLTSRATGALLRQAPPPGAALDVHHRTPEGLCVLEYVLVAAHLTVCGYTGQEEPA